MAPRNSCMLRTEWSIPARGVRRMARPRLLGLLSVHQSTVYTRHIIRPAKGGGDLRRYGGELERRRAAWGGGLFETAGVGHRSEAAYNPLPRPRFA